MRTIKYRVWDKQNKEMLYNEKYGNDLLVGPGYVCEELDLLVDEGYIRVNFLGLDDEFIPLEFTGLLDKNGREIYEGDIVKWGVNTLFISFGWGDDPEHYGECYGVLVGSSVFSGSHKDCEVVGNIYENRELITP